MRSKMRSRSAKGFRYPATAWNNSLRRSQRRKLRVETSARQTVLLAECGFAGAGLVEEIGGGSD